MWLLRVAATPIGVPAQAVAVDTTPSLQSDLTRLMGADPVAEVRAEAAVPSDSRFKLIGVVAAPSAQAVAKSLALIAVDGKPARAFRVGAAVDGDLVLQAVSARGVELGPSGGAAAVKLDLALLAPAATGTLPIPGMSPSARPVALPARAVSVQPVQPAPAQPIEQPPAESSEPADGAVAPLASPQPPIPTVGTPPVPRE